MAACLAVDGGVWVLKVECFMNKNNTDINKSQKKSELQNADKNAVDLSRRRLAKAGLIAAPILATLPGKPAMANYVKNNCTVSGNISGNMSDNANNTDPCLDYLGGKTPGYWGQKPNEWPVPFDPGNCISTTPNPGNGGGSGCQDYDDTGTKFHDISYFGGSRQMVSGTSRTMMQVIHLTGVDDPYQLDAHTVAALLNAVTWGKNIYGYSPEEVIALYNEYHLTNPVELRDAFQYLNEKG